MNDAGVARVSFFRDSGCIKEERQTNKEPLLSVQELYVIAKDGANKKGILNGISFSLHKGEVLVITGETGSGKTMTAKAIIGMLSSNLDVKGKILLNGQNLLELKPAEMQKLRGRKLGMAFQNPETALNPLLKNKSQLNLIMERDERKQLKRLNLFGLKEKRILKQYPFELSGGMAQRFMTALSLGHGVELVIFDEPTRGLDSASRNLLAELINLLSHQQNVAVLLLTHDMELTEKVADTCLVLQKGKVVEHGSAEAVLNNPHSSYMRELRASDPRNRRILPLRTPNSNYAAKERKVPILEIKHLNCSYCQNFLKKEKNHVLKNLTLNVSHGETLGLLGDSGCGKSTLASCVLGLREYEGEIYFEGSLLKRRIGKRSIGLISQSATSSFNPVRTIRQSLAEIFLVHPEYAKRGDVEGQIYEILKAVDLHGLYSRLNSYPKEFSGGQLQRFAIARTLLSQAKLIILDEVTSMLDFKTQATVIRLLARLQEERNLSYLFITHDLPLAQQFCDRVMLMRNGQVEEYNL